MSEEDEFIKLQTLWYEKLKQSGFQDLETSRGFLKDWPSQRLRRDYTPERFQEKLNYYRFASQLLWEFKFKTKLEKKIWELHTEGKSMREISFQVRTHKNKMNHNKVRKVINKLSPFVYAMIINEEE
jgi:hypothetical protein